VRWLGDIGIVVIGRSLGAQDARNFEPQSRQKRHSNLALTNI
jgi:hypothetical protein